jgi:hypothetical protein
MTNDDELAPYLSVHFGIGHPLVPGIFSAPGADRDDRPAAVPALERDEAEEKAVAAYLDALRSPRS